jgi:hypothetical protein
MPHLDYASSIETQKSPMLSLTAFLRLVALLSMRVSPTRGCRSAGVQPPLESRAHVAPTPSGFAVLHPSHRALWVSLILHPLQCGAHVANRNPSCLVPLRARCRHNVIHQNRPFPGLCASGLSVAGLKRDDTTFSMSSNVIIFMVKPTTRFPCREVAACSSLHEPQRGTNLATSTNLSPHTAAKGARK